MELEKLQSILLENDEKKLGEFIKNHVSNTDRNTNKLEQIYNDYLALKKDFSIDQPYKIKKFACDLLEEINFFKAADSFLLHAIEDSQGCLNAEKQKYQQLKDSQSCQNNQQEQTFQDMRLIIVELKKLLRLFQKNNEEKLDKLVSELNSNTNNNIKGVNNEPKEKPNKLKKLAYTLFGKIKNKFSNSTGSTSLQSVEKNDAQNQRTQYEKVIEDMKKIIQQLEEHSSDLLKEDETKLRGVIRNNDSNTNNIQKGKDINNQNQILQKELSVVENPKKMDPLVIGIFKEVSIINASDSPPRSDIEESEGQRNEEKEKQKEFKDNQSLSKQYEKTVSEMQLIIQELRGKNEQQSLEITNLQQQKGSYESEISDLRKKIQSQQSEILSLSQQNKGVYNTQFSNNTQEKLFQQSCLSFMANPYLSNPL